MFKKLTEERTKGQVAVKIFTGGVLGSDMEMIEAIRAGNLEMSVLAPGSIGPTVPEAELAALPYLFRDGDHYEKFVNGPLGKKLYDIIEKKGRLTTAGMFGKSTRHIITRKKPIFRIADLKGLKMRIFPSKTLEEYWKALGAIPSLIAYAEVYTALQTGVVDGAENEPATFYTFKWAEPSQYICYDNHEITIRYFVIGTDFLNKLPGDIKDAVLKSAWDAGNYERGIESKYDHEALEQCQKKYGIKVTMPYRKEFIEATEGVRQMMGKKWGLEDMVKQVMSIK